MLDITVSVQEELRAPVGGGLPPPVQYDKRDDTACLYWSLVMIV